MILSFHPCFIGDRNLVCAGRSPGCEDLTAVKSADAVILPQGCSQALYAMVRENCAHVFPNYDVRFAYPGKIGQINLFQKIHAAYPHTETFPDVRSFFFRYDRLQNLGFPLEENGFNS